MSSILIKNAQIVNENSTRHADLFIKNGRIEKIDPDLSNLSADQTIDATGKILLPGMIDAHVHFREPGMENKADLHSETRAAVAGGVTSFMEMPNTKPATVTNQLLEEKFTLAATKSLANYSFYLGASNKNIDELCAADPQKVCGIKLFMGASTGNLLVDRPQTLEAIFKNVNLPIAVHCERTDIIQANEKQIRARYGDAIPIRFHPIIRSEEACYKSTAHAIELAKKHNAQLHILHITTARELHLLNNAPVSEKKITAEACPHHLWFCEDDYETLGTKIKVNPAIKTAADRAALRAALLEGTLDTVGTDHAPHLLAEKNQPYSSAPSGLPNIQTALISLLEFLPPEVVAQKTAHNPARIFNIQDRGFIREGYWADLILIDPKKNHTVSTQNIEYKCGWSPFENLTFKNSISSTLVSGQLAFHNDQIFNTVRGKRLVFNRF